jgi:hypothetical protein
MMNYPWMYYYDNKGRMVNSPLLEGCPAAAGCFEARSGLGGFTTPSGSACHPFTKKIKGAKSL